MLATNAFHDALRLTNRVQRYDWGSTRAIPDLLGVRADGEPQAELWLGAHPSGPSTVNIDSASVSLGVLAREAPVQVLGHRVAEQFGPRLPYLLKILAAARALSLQVHPSPQQARDGFAKENKRMRQGHTTERTFHDDQHKPELVVAVTQFEGLAGFRSRRATLALLEGLEGEIVRDLRRTLQSGHGGGCLRAAFSSLLAVRGRAMNANDIAVTITSLQNRLADGSPFPRADRTAVELAEQHPGDPGAIASLMLNRFSLEPGESVFLPAREVHAYLSGLGVEVMASSDNVLRAGLTHKRVDADALLRCASFSPRLPATAEVTTTGRYDSVTTYRVPVAEFALTTADVIDGDQVSLVSTGPRILLCLDGDLDVVCARSSRGAVRLTRGNSVFVPHDAGATEITGQGHAVCAWVP